MPAREIMTRGLSTCFEDQDWVRRLTVLDRRQATVGILSVDDLARCSHDLAGEVLEAVAPWSH
jgi:hypothetical protein